MSSLTDDDDYTDDHGLFDLLISRDVTVTMVKKMFSLALPIIAGNICWLFLQSLTESYIGRRLGSEALAQYAVGLSTFNVFGLTLGFGFMSALDTLVSQAYGRSPTNKEIGELLQRSIVVDVIASIPIILLFLHIGPLLTLMYGESLAEGAVTILRNSSMYLVLSLIDESICRTLQAQNLPEVPMVASLVALLTCWTGCHFHITQAPTDAIWVLTVTHVAFTVALVAASFLHPRCALRYARWPISSSVYDWTEMLVFVRVGVPSLVAMCAEWWGFEIMYILISHVSDMDVAIFGVVLVFTSLAFSVCIGVSEAGSVCIGNALGERNTIEAKAYVSVVFLAGQAVSILTVIIIFLGKHVIPPLFISDGEALDRLTALIPLIALFHWGDALSLVWQGIFHGTGKQLSAANAVAFSLWLVGLPTCWYLGVYHSMGVTGVLIGIVAGFSVEVPIMVTSCLSWNWDELMEEASKSLDEVAHGDDDSFHHSEGTVLLA